MTIREYLDAVARAGETGMYMTGSVRPWGVEWKGSKDPFTNEEQRTWYATPTEALTAASGQSYSPAAFSRATELADAIAPDGSI